MANVLKRTSRTKPANAPAEANTPSKSTSKKTKPKMTELEALQAQRQEANELRRAKALDFKALASGPEDGIYTLSSVDTALDKNQTPYLKLALSNELDDTIFNLTFSMGKPSDNAGKLTLWRYAFEHAGYDVSSDSWSESTESILPLPSIYATEDDSVYFAIKDAQRIVTQLKSVGIYADIRKRTDTPTGTREMSRADRIKAIALKRTSSESDESARNYFIEYHDDVDALAQAWLDLLSTLLDSDDPAPMNITFKPDGSKRYHRIEGFYPLDSE